MDKIKENVRVLWEHPCRECQYVACDLLVRNKKRLDKEDLPFIEECILTKSWWDTFDLIASHLVGIIFKKYPDARNKTVEKWVSSNNIRLNRSTLIYQLKYKNDVDFDVMKYCMDRLQHKHEFFIQKAIWWVLRQYSKFNPEEVRNYIQKSSPSNLAINEGSKYIKN